VTGYGDAAIHKAQSWLSRHFSVANPIAHLWHSERSFSSGGSKARPGSRRSITFSGCVWKRRSSGSSERTRRWMRSAEGGLRRPGVCAPAVQTDHGRDGRGVSAEVHIPEIEIP